MLLVLVVTVWALAACGTGGLGNPNDWFGNSSNEPGKIIYTVSADGTYASVTGYEGQLKDADIAAEYEGVPVKKIHDSAFCNSSLESVVIPASVTAIGKAALDNCSALKSIEVAEGNEYYKSLDKNLYTKDGKTLIKYAIGKTATSFTIPEDVEIIGSNALSGSKSLQSITIPNGVTSIEERAFCACSALQSITIPASIKDIGKEAFASCTALTRVDFTNNGQLTSIGHSAFMGCFALAGVSIPDGVTVIDDMAFWACSELSSASIPSSVTKIGSAAFSACQKLSSIDVSESNEYYQSIDGHLCTKDGKTFIQYAEGKPSTTFTVPNGVEAIADNAFSNCHAITKVIIPASVTSIGTSAFEFCVSLASIEIHGSITSVEDNVFWGCSALTSVVLFDSVTGIDAGMFDSCDSLVNIAVREGNEYYKSLDGNLYTKEGKTLIRYATGKTDSTFTVPDGVEVIGECAFSSCIALTEAVFPESITSISNGAFENCRFLASIEVAEGNEYYKSLNGTLYTKDGKTLIKYAEGKTDTAFTVPDGVEVIGDYAFYCCDELTTISLPDTVTSIGDCAFSACLALTSISLPDGVTSIGEGAFSMCENLASIEVAQGNEHYKSLNGNLYTKDGKNLVKYAAGKTDTAFTVPDGVEIIGNGAFHSCIKLTSISLPDSVTSIGRLAFIYCYSLTDINISKNTQITSIGDYAFDGCLALTSITIPDSVTSIGEGAFDIGGKCSAIYYGSTSAEWEELNIDYPANITIYYYSEKAPETEGNFWYYDEDGNAAVW